ncbi:MAG: LysR family transcriptional regulator [Lachnospiraceae bacterium]|jgi:DNA-binding transcriptional LysR family regulator|nr:LysR family transcriptional regulator [Lachnospiraceae bacterium]MDD4524401.1 LysR family transcriptional regulator [Lachnospiraceae bacterium]
MQVNLEYYRVFYYVAQTGSLSRAAEQLSVSQPAVSQSLRQLENTLGTSLFTRTSRGVKLTKEGELLFSYVRRGYENIETGEKKLRQMLNLDIGELHIGASDMTLRFYLLPYLEKFHEKHPNIKVSVTNAPTPETLGYLENETIDFGVVSGPLPEMPQVEAIKVREIQDTFVAARRFIQYRNRTLDLHDLEKLPLISLEGKTSSRSYIDSFMAKNGVTIRPEFELATSDMIVQFALRNLGVGCVVRDFAAPFLESGQLFELRFNKYIPQRNFYVTVNRNVSLPAAATGLLEMIRAGDKTE